MIPFVDELEPIKGSVADALGERKTAMMVNGA
jgi:hypothetical protein